MDTIDVDHVQSLTKTARLLSFAIRMLAWIVIRVLWVNFKVENRKVIPKKGPVIIVGANHTSLADALFMYASIRRAFAGIGMAELTSDEWPWIIRRAFDLLGHIPIVRGNAGSGDLVSQQALRILESNHALTLWPQGRQIHRGDQTIWYPGFARFAKKTGAKIYVFKIEGPDEFWPTNPNDSGPQKFNLRAKVRARFSEPIDPADYATVEEVVMAVKQVHAQLPLAA